MRMPPLIDHDGRGRHSRTKPRDADTDGADGGAEDFFARFVKSQAEATRTAMKTDWVQRGTTWRSKSMRWVVRACWRLFKRIMRRAWRHRVTLAPFLLCAVTYFVTAIASLVDKGWITILAGFGTGTPIIYWTLGGRMWVLTRRRGLKAFTERMWIASGYATIAMLGVITAAAGGGPPLPGLWLVAGLTLSIATAVFRHRKRRSIIPADEMDERQIKWDRIKKVKGAILGPPQDLDSPARWVAQVDLTDTDMLVVDFAACGPHIAKRYRVGRTNVIIDDLIPGEDALARLTVTLENPLFQVVEFDDSWLDMPEAGCFRFHSYSDGGVGLFRLWTPESGTVNAFFSGDIGSGKSGAIFTAAIQATMTGRVHLIVGDPQGQSLPALGVVSSRQLGEDGYADNAERVFLQLVKLHAAMLARSAYLKRYVWRNEYGDLNVGMEFFDQEIMGRQQANPATGEHPLFWPMVVYILEEAHKAAGDPDYGSEIVRLLAQIVKLSRKTGIAVWVCNQNPGIEELGNDSALRQNLVAGNILCYRNSSKQTGVMILDSHMPEPHTIPKLTPDGEQTQGMVVASCPARGSNRSTIARSPFIRRKTFWATRAAERVMPLEDVFMAAWTDADIERQEEALAAEVTAYLKAKAGQGAGTGSAGPGPADVEGEPWKQGTVPARCVAYLRHLEVTTGFGETTTGILAHETGSALNAVSQALGRLARPNPTRKRPKPVPVVHSPRDGTWALGPAPAKQLAGSAA